MGHFWQSIQQQLTSPFITGGFLLMFTGSIIAFARNLPLKLWGKLCDQFMVNVTVQSNDPLFDWITLWLNDHPYSQRTRHLLGSTIANYGEESGYDGPTINAKQGREDTEDTEDLKRPRLILSPAKGQHFFMYGKTLLWLSRGNEDTPEASGSANKVQQRFTFRMESYHLRVFGRSQYVLRQLLTEVIDRAVAFQAKKISAFVGVYSSWRRLRTFVPRQMDSVILPEGVAESILGKLKEFIAQKDWYRDMGIPYHLGMLFHGIPGTGKTSTIGALAGEMKMNLYILSLASEDMNDERFACLLSEIQPCSLMVLEDVDAAFAARKRTEGDNKPTQGLTLTGILNSLDGFMASEGSIVLMTTNHKDRLDPALIRPGRVDFDIEFSTATTDQLRRLYARFFPGFASLQGEAFVWANRMVGRTMAEAQQDLLLMKTHNKHRVTEARGIVRWKNY